MLFYMGVKLGLSHYVISLGWGCARTECCGRN